MVFTPGANVPNFRLEAMLGVAGDEFPLKVHFSREMLTEAQGNCVC
jgi:hypothetical protein